MSSGMKFFLVSAEFEILHKESFSIFAPIVEIGAFLHYLQFPIKKVAEPSCNLQVILLQCVSHILSREDICT